MSLYDDADAKPFPGWHVLELMGHRRLAGLVSEETVAGAGFLRIDVYPGDAERPTLTQKYPPSSVYCLTPCTEATARRIAAAFTPQPVRPFELPPARREPHENFIDREEQPDRDDTDDCPECGVAHSSAECPPF